MTLRLDAFARLGELLRSVSPVPGRQPIRLDLGEFRCDLPVKALRPLAVVEDWGRYPPLGGTTELRAAYIGWLERRFGLPSTTIDSRIAVEPTPGSKQAIAALIGIAVNQKRAKGTKTPVVVLPNPFYPAYCAAAGAVSASVAFYTFGGGQYAATVRRAIASAADGAAAVVVCSPGNPRGELLSTAVLREIAAAAGEVGALLIVDECYVDLVTSELPPGCLSIAGSSLAADTPFAVLHTLSKRCGAPGLRSGFVAGDPATVRAYAQYNRACGVSSSYPVCAVASALWSDDAHVSSLRAALARNWRTADIVLGDVPGYRRAEAGFFLWLPVPDDESFARDLWQDQAMSVMPGRYLGTENADGVNPGAGHIRVALVHGEATMSEALVRLRRSFASAIVEPGHAADLVRDETSHLRPGSGEPIRVYRDSMP